MRRKLVELPLLLGEVDALRREVCNESARAADDDACRVFVAGQDARGCVYALRRRKPRQPPPALYVALDEIPVQDGVLVLAASVGPFARERERREEDSV